MGLTLKRYTIVIGIVHVLIISLLSGCCGENKPSITKVPEKAATQEFTTPAVMETTIAAISSSRLATECIGISGDASTNLIRFIGRLFMVGQDGLAYILDLSTGEKTYLSGILGPVISPNGSTIAYYDMHVENIVIADEFGKKITDISLGKLFLPAHWLNEEYLVLDNMGYESSNKQSHMSSLIITNPFTGEKHELLPEYPDIRYFSQPAFQWEGYYSSRIVPNPTLTYLVYPSMSWDLILWDLVNSREVQRVHEMDYQNTPWWSPDGTRFITSVPIENKLSDGEKHIIIYDGLPYVGGNELIMINQEGIIKRITYFNY